jgi:hypothetical protein
VTGSPSKTSMDAHVDQKLAMARDMRADLVRAGDDGESVLSLADAIAGVTRQQFPDTAHLGRITVAVLVGLDSLQEAFAVKGMRLSLREALMVAGLAAEQLEREGAGRD